jgi:ATP-dependent DNA helicase RecG
MTVFGDLDISTIRHLPKGRQPIATHVVALADHPGWYPRIWERLAEEVKAGRQGFVVAPAISPTVREENAELTEDEPEAAPRPLATVLETLPMVKALPQCQGMRIEAVHGQMSADDKDAVMQAFAAGEIDILVATTVIEVGIDVPNSTAMVILDADRFGVSQLHQLRGRVGRGSHAGVCLLVTHCDADTPARARVDAVAGTLDGFDLAQIDLELRSEGDVLGVRQSGRRSSLTLVRVTTDGELIDRAREYAEALVAEDETLDSYPMIRRDIQRRLDDQSAEFLDKN